jgi:hypothetical protein
MDIALRRLLVGLERPAHLDQWRRRPLDNPTTQPHRDYRELPKTA